MCGVTRKGPSLRPIILQQHQLCNPLLIHREPCVLRTRKVRAKSAVLQLNRANPVWHAAQYQLRRRESQVDYFDVTIEFFIA
jgi:hypothetical protein